MEFRIRSVDFFSFFSPKQEGNESMEGREYIFEELMTGDFPDLMT